MTIARAREKLVIWITWHLPKQVVYWCAIRLVAHATTGKYSNQNVTQLTATEALERWEIT